VKDVMLDLRNDSIYMRDIHVSLGFALVFHWTIVVNVIAQIE